MGLEELQRNPLVKVGLNWLGNALLDQFQMQPEPEREPEPPELAEIPDLLNLRKLDGAVITITGRPFTGKSVAARRIAQILGRPTYAISPHEEPPQWITPLRFEEILDSPPPYSTLIMDDIVTYMSSKSYSDKLVKKVEKIFPTARHERKLIVIPITQVTSLMDKYGLRADVLICKPADILYAATERPAVKQLLDQIEPMWEGRSEHWIHRHAYFLGHSWRGVVTISKPIRQTTRPADSA